MHFIKTKSISEVYFSGGFFHHIQNEKKGQRTSVNINFTKDRKNWYIPAFYTCPKGIVFDVCVQTSYAGFKNYIANLDTDTEIKNPMEHNFNSRLIRNKKMIMCQQLQCITYTPDNTDCKEALKLVKHYKLSVDSCWSIYRLCFPCHTKSKTEILSLQILAETEFITAAMFRISEGDEIQIHHPVTGKDYTLKALSITDESFNFGNTEYTYPSHYKMLRYSLSPEPDDLGFIVRDTANSDPVKKPAAEYRLIPESSCSIGIIGGADGPDVVTAGHAPSESERAYTVCSALHFSPPDDVLWKFIFMTKTQEDRTISIKRSEKDPWQSWKDASKDHSTLY